MGHELRVSLRVSYANYVSKGALQTVLKFDGKTMSSFSDRATCSESNKLAFWFDCVLTSKFSRPKTAARFLVG